MTAGSISQARLDQNKVRKRRQTVFRKLDELQKYGVDIYVVINQNNRYYTYTSKKTESWPPSPGKIVRVVLNMVGAGN